MILRFLPAGLYLFGLALFGVATFDYFTPADGPGVAIDEPEREFPTHVVGLNLDAAFRIHNPTRHTARIVGVAEC